MARGLSVRTRAAGGLAVAGALFLLLSMDTAIADSEPRVTDIQPARAGELLVIRLETAGLPGPRILSTLSSGLASAVEIHLELTGEDGDQSADRHYEIRLDFDLWEEVYTVYIGSDETRFNNLAGLQGFLDDLPPLALARVADLDPGARYQVTAGLKLHPLAPDARGRVQEMVSGTNPRGRATGNPGQEVLVSLGRLIRFFYRGESPRGDLVGALQSGPFTTRELNDAPH